MEWPKTAIKMLVKGTPDYTAKRKLNLEGKKKKSYKETTNT